MPKKVLFLITKSNWGGAQRYVYDLATGLPKEEFEAVVALGGDGPLGAKLQAAGIRVIPIPSLQRDISLGKEWLAFWETADIIRRERPRILHINSSKAGAFGALLGRLLLVRKIIFTAHGWAFNEDRPSWQRFILKFIHWITVLMADDTIAVSREVKRQMNWPFTQKKVVVIHNGRAIAELSSRAEARRARCERAPRLLPHRHDFWSMTIAELHPVKRHEAVIEVMHRLKEAGKNIKHLIISGGQQLEALQRQVDRLELTDTVFLLGPIDEAARYLKAADVFILASRSEAMPYVIIEAMISEVPTVATAVGGIPEIIENGLSGLLVPPADNDALYKTVMEVYENPDLRDRLAAGARDRQADFTFEKTLEKTLNLYKN